MNLAKIIGDEGWSILSKMTTLLYYLIHSLLPITLFYYLIQSSLPNSILLETPELGNRS